jgi:hypothetical protein
MSCHSAVTLHYILGSVSKETVLLSAQEPAAVLCWFELVELMPI